MQRIAICAVLALLAVATPSANAAGIGQSTTPVGGGFANACAGSGVYEFSGQPGTGFHNGVSDQYFTCAGGSSAAGGFISGAAANQGSNLGYLNNTYTWSNSAYADATAGLIHFSAGNTGSSNTFFPAGVADAGWNDSLNIGGGVGSGTLVIPIHIDGIMTANGLGALGRVQVSAYKNSVQLYDSALFQALNPTRTYGSAASGTDRATIRYTVADYGPGTSLTVTNLNVNHLIYFPIPFTFGTSFEFGIYANAYAGEISAGAGIVTNTTTLNFHNTLYYAGSAWVIAPDNSIITNLTFTSASGFDYQNAAMEPAPEPATWFLGGLSLLIASAYRKNFRRQ